MYLFIYGRDPELSRLELNQVLTNDTYDFELVEDAPGYAIVEFKQTPSTKTFESLAGIVRVLKLISADHVLDISILGDELDYLQKKFNYFVGYLNIDSEETEIFDTQIKYKFKEANYKAQIKKSDKSILPSPQKYFSWDLENGVELLIIKLQDSYYYFRTVFAPDPSTFQALDESRPQRRFTHGTSFRLARIMVNLLPKNKDQMTLVDPFCGTGTFLIEGLKAKFNVIGIDNDPELVKDAKINLDWFKNLSNSKGSVTIKLGNSTIANFKADHCVFEPFMGPFLKAAPHRKEAIKTYNELTELYRNTFKNLHSNLAKGGEVICILPYLTASSGEAFNTANDTFQKYFKKIDLGEGIQNPIEYKTPDGNWIGRRIYILKRLDIVRK